MSRCDRVIYILVPLDAFVEVEWCSAFEFWTRPSYLIDRGTNGRPSSFIRLSGPQTPFLLAKFVLKYKHSYGSIIE